MRESGNHDRCTTCHRVHMWLRPREDSRDFIVVRGNDTDHTHRYTSEPWCGVPSKHWHFISDYWTVVGSPIEEPRIVHDGSDFCYALIPEIRKEDEPDYATQAVDHRTIQCKRWVRVGEAR